MPDGTSTRASGQAAPKAGKSHFRWVVLTLIFAVYTLAAADRANIGIVLPFIKTEMKLSNTEAGAIVSLFFIGYSAAQIPAGILVKAFGVSRIFPIFMVLTSAFTALIGTAASPLVLKVSRLALGFAEGPLPVAMLSTINRWFPASEKGTAAGVFLAAAKFGPVLMPPLGALVIATLGWHYIFFFCAIPGIFLALIWFVAIPDDPSGSRFTSTEERRLIAEVAPATIAGQPADGPTVGANRRFERLDVLLRARPFTRISTSLGAFKSANVWGVAIGYLLMTGIINVILAWLPTYLTTEKHLSLMNVGIIAAAPFVGGVLGNPLGGLLSDRLLGKRRKPNILITALASVVMMYALVYAPNDLAALAFLLFMTGFLLNIGYSAFTIYPASLTTKEIYPLAVSIVNTGGQAGGAVFPFVTGVILDNYGWDTVFLFLSAASLLTFLIMAFVVEPRD